MTQELDSDRNRFSLADFTGHGYDQGRPRFIEALWLLTSGCLVSRRWCPNRLRLMVLRAFGANIGSGVLVRHNVEIHWPWKFDNAPIAIGDHVWICARATVLRGVSIGDGATIGATSLIARDVPAGKTVLAPVGGVL